MAKAIQPRPPMIVMVNIPRIGGMDVLDVLDLGAQCFVGFYQAGIVGGIPALIVDRAGQQQDNLVICGAFYGGLLHGGARRHGKNHKQDCDQRQ